MMNPSCHFCLFFLSFLLSIVSIRSKNFVSKSANSVFDEHVFEVCDKFLEPVLKKRIECMREEKEVIIDMCVNFSTDVEFLLPFILHHLALGISKIYIYNNDASIAWFNHPTILCLLYTQTLIIQPWPGDAVGLLGYNHCLNQIEKNNRKSKYVWQAVLDMDEFIVLKKDKCLPKLLKSVNGPALGIHWAFYLPKFSAGLKATANFPADRIALPHEVITERVEFIPLVKSIARIACVRSWPDPHFAIFHADCPLGKTMQDVLGNKLELSRLNRSQAIETMAIVQINHYWTLSLRYFLRKIHRGYGSERSRHKGSHFRSTAQLFQHAGLKTSPDLSFDALHGDLFRQLKSICSSCFNTTYYYQ